MLVCLALYSRHNIVHVVAHISNSLPCFWIEWPSATCEPSCFDSPFICQPLLPLWPLLPHVTMITAAPEPLSLFSRLWRMNSEVALLDHVILGLSLGNTHFVTVTASFLHSHQQCWGNPVSLHPDGFFLRSVCSTLD